MVNAFQFFRENIELWPHDHDGKRPSNGTVRRWLTQKAVRVNGKRPTMHDNIEFPIWDLVFFPGGKHATTTYWTGGFENGDSIELPRAGRPMESRWGWLSRPEPPPLKTSIVWEWIDGWCPLVPKNGTAEIDLVADYWDDRV